MRRAAASEGTSHPPRRSQAGVPVHCSPTWRSPLTLARPIAALLVLTMTATAASLAAETMLEAHERAEEKVRETAAQAHQIAEHIESQLGALRSGSLRSWLAAGPSTSPLSDADEAKLKALLRQAEPETPEGLAMRQALTCYGQQAQLIAALVEAEWESRDSSWSWDDHYLRPGERSWVESLADASYLPPNFGEIAGTAHGPRSFHYDGHWIQPDGADFQSELRCEVHGAAPFTYPDPGAAERAFIRKCHAMQAYLETAADAIRPDRARGTWKSPDLDPDVIWRDLEAAGKLRPFLQLPDPRSDYPVPGVPRDPGNEHRFFTAGWHRPMHCSAHGPYIPAGQRDDWE